MKKFKLKQKYPSLPKDWEAGMEVGLGDRNYGYSPCHGKYSDHRKLDNSEVEKSEGFWEEIIPKEWEILSFTDGVEISNRIGEVSFQCLEKEKYKAIRFYNNTKCAYAEHNQKISSCSEGFMLKNYKINSIKRLSDGVIFTLGDIILNGSNYVISSITVEDNEALLWVEDDYCSLSIECAKKVEYLHTTKDGYKINKGDKYFIVDNFRVREVVGGTFTKSKWDDFRFKDREKAENWILYNKRCLSLNDVMQRFTVRNINCEDLKKLIKTRL